MPEAAAALAPLFASLPAPALLFEPDGTIRAANARARDLLASSATPLEGRALGDIIVLPEDTPPLRPGTIETRLRAPETRQVALAIGALPGPETALLAVLRDRTGDERSVQNRVVREKLDAVAQLASGVAHEFNNIMASLYGFAQLARQDPQFHADLVAAVEEYTERSREITKRLRSFSPGHDEPFLPLDLAELLDAVIARNAGPLARAEIRVVRRFEQNLPRTLGARGELHEVFDALLDFAAAANVRGGTIAIDLARDGDGVLARVADSGTGIPRENLTRIFEPFFTMKSTEGGPVRGGLGLAVAYAHVRRHEGEMWAESEMGRGTTISVRLPLRGERRRQQAEIAVERRRGAAGVSSRAVLAVDDDDGMLRLLEQILGGHELVPARSVPDALAALRLRAFDYVILDLLMPGDLDGFALFDEIMRAPDPAKVILLTGSREDDRLRAYVARAYGYLRKPFGIKDIQSLIV